MSEIKKEVTDITWIVDSWNNHNKALKRVDKHGSSNPDSTEFTWVQNQHTFGLIILTPSY